MLINSWKFGKPVDDLQTYADGTIVQHRMQQVFLNDVAVGEVEIHMHKRRGKDRKVDVSFGATMIVYGPPKGGS